MADFNFNDEIDKAVGKALDKRLCGDTEEDNTPAPVVEETSAKAIEGKASSGGGISLSIVTAQAIAAIKAA